MQNSDFEMSNDFNPYDKKVPGIIRREGASAGKYACRSARPS